MFKFSISFKVGLLISVLNHEEVVVRRQTD
jgi:hypothetical protein